VEVWEASDAPGGHASTVRLADTDGGGGFVMNDCALGGTYTNFGNTLALLEALGWTAHHNDFPSQFSTGAPDEVEEGAAAAAAASGMTGAGGGAEPTGAEPAGAAAAAAGEAWSVLRGAAAFGSGVEDSPLYRRHARDIRALVRALRWLWGSQQLLLLLATPLRLLCRVLLCSDAFWEEMVAPLGVIFFGTGGRMGDCPVIILAGARAARGRERRSQEIEWPRRHLTRPSSAALTPRLVPAPARGPGAFFDDADGAVPSLVADDARLVAPRPLPFFTFPRLDRVYVSLARAAAAPGSVTFRLGHPAAAVEAARGPGTRPAAVDAAGRRREFDAVILACHAPAALRLLRDPGRAHKLALGGVEYYTQSTILHVDEDYVRRCVCAAVGGGVMRAGGGMKAGAAWVAVQASRSSGAVES
jgi:hypothetical protein